MASEIIVNTIKAPTTGSNANKVIIPSGVTLDASAATVDASNGLITPAGHVIQCITDTKTVGNSYHDADLEDISISAIGGFSSAVSVQSLNITPKFSNSKILVQWTGQMRMNSTGGGGIQMFFGKDGSNLMTSGGNNNSAVFMYNSSTMQDYYQAQSAQFAFTAGQTTQMTLDVRMSCYNSPATIFLSHDGLECLTAWEIAQ